MDRRHQKEVSNQLLNFLDDPNDIPVVMKNNRKFLFTGGLFLFLVSTVAYNVMEYSIFWRFFLFTLTGYALGLGIAQHTAINQWRVLKKHINRESLANRIKELEG